MSTDDCRRGKRFFPCGQTRREFVWEMGAGFVGLALSALLGEDGFFDARARATEAARGENPLAVKPPHFATQAKACIFLMMNGGPSHVDTFDYKPSLAKYAGQPLPPDKKFTNSGNRKMGFLTPACREFRPGGQSGLMISDYFPRVREHADKLAVIRSCHTDSHAHGSALVAMNTGSTFIGRPSLGSWAVYGLGTDEPEPARLRGDHGQARRADQRSAELVQRLHAGQLSRHAVPAGRRTGARLARALGSHGTARTARPAGPAESAASGRSTGRIGAGRADSKLRIGLPHAGRSARSGRPDEGRSADARHVRRRQRADRRVRPQLPGRAAAGRAGRALRAALFRRRPPGRHLGRPRKRREESRPARRARSTSRSPPCLPTWSAAGCWTARWSCGGANSAACRLPKGEGAPGRNHNPYGFTMWMAGGGVKGGMSYGETDEFGFAATENKVHLHDLHATILAPAGPRPRAADLFSSRTRRATDRRFRKRH